MTKESEKEEKLAVVVEDKNSSGENEEGNTKWMASLKPVRGSNTKWWKKTIFGQTNKQTTSFKQTNEGVTFTITEQRMARLNY